MNREFSTLIRIGGGGLLLLGLLKWVGLLRGDFAHQADPIFGCSLALVGGISAFLEAAIGIICFLSPHPIRAGIFFITLSEGWLIYQIFHNLMRLPGRCPCLGPLPFWFPWLGGHESPILASIAVWFLLIGWGILLLRRDLVIRQ